MSPAALTATHRARLARAVAVISVGALAVHQLRYAIAFGEGAGRALSAEGHGYLADAIAPLVALAIATLAAAILVGSAAGRRAARGGAVRRAFTFSLALLAVFTVQELVEGAVASGHPHGLAGVFGGGGWLAVPLSLALGLLAAWFAGLLDRVEEQIGARRQSLRPWRARRLKAPRPDPRSTVLATLALAFGFGRRAPPPSAVR